MGRTARGTARARHVSVQHRMTRACFGGARGTARARVRILGTRVLKALHDEKACNEHILFFNESKLKIL